MRRFTLLASIMLFHFLQANSNAAEHNKDTGSAGIRAIQQGEIEKLRILSNNNMPKKVVVVLSSSTESFVNELVDTLASINAQSEKLNLRLHVICSSRSKAARFIKKMEQEGHEEMVEVNDRFHTSDRWMQDWGEIAVADIKDQQGPKMLIVDSNRGRGLARLPSIFADLWNAFYIKNPRRGVKGDYGGNIEVTPDNVLIQGTTSSDELRELFDDHGYAGKRALLDTNWLQVGHVDEYVTFVPNPAADGGYTIVKSDPGLAIELIKNATEDQLEAMNPIYLSTIREIHDALNNEGFARIANANYDLSKSTKILEGPALNTLDEKSRAARLQELHWLVDLNRAISDLVDANIEILINRIKAVTNTPNRKFQVVSLPTIFTGGKYGDELYRCVAMMPGVVNMLVLGNHLIIPDAQMPMLNDFIQNTMETIELKPHFLDDMAYHELSGEIHCGTNVIREHDKRFLSQFKCLIHIKTM